MTNQFRPRIGSRLAVLAVLVVPTFLVSFTHATFARDRFRAVRLESGLTIVPFAVPVATPVTVLGPSQVHYGYAPAPQPPNAAAAGDRVDPQLLAEFEAFRRWRESQYAASAADSTTDDAIPSAARPTMPLVAEHCLRCHSGSQAKGDFHLDAELTDDQRLSAIRAALTGEMPKGKPLSPDQLGPLLYELSQARRDE